MLQIHPDLKKKSAAALSGSADEHNSVHSGHSRKHREPCAARHLWLLSSQQLHH